jgi:hypothetical protein
MSGPEGFLSRWSRRKLVSPRNEAFSPAPPARGEPQTETSGREAAQDVPLEAGEPTSGAFDPACPSIESIAADTDLSSFLQPGVPEELTRTALRRAWVTDPKVRDFIGIAESQWDFNEPGAMPGFGPLTAADAAAALAGQMLGGAGSGSRMIADASAAVLQAAPVGDDESVDRLRQTDPNARIADLPNERSEQAVAEKHDRAPGKDFARGYPRSHGGALPH